MAGFCRSFACCRQRSAKVVTPAPYLEYSDLVNGPPSGGPDSLGAIVTIFGAAFGKARRTSSVTLAEAPVHHILHWSDRKIVFQIDSTAKSGELHVLANGKRSNALSFAVTPGSIHFVSATEATAEVVRSPVPGRP